MRRLDAGVRVTRIEYVGGVQERGALHADVDERRLHAGQDPRYAALVDIADQAAAAGALQKHFLQHAVFDDRGARLVGAGVDQNFSAHGLPVLAVRAQRHASRSNSAVSNNGRSHHSGVAAAEIRDENGCAALNGVGARLVARFSGIPVGAGLGGIYTAET